MSGKDLMNKPQLDASSFRIILSISLVLIVILSAVGFSYAHQFLSKYATDIAHKKVDASASDTTIASLQKVQQTIEQNQGLIEKINTLRADSKFPEFMIVDEMKTIAKRNHISISSYSFGGSDSSGSTGATTQPGAAGQPAVTPTQSSDTVSLTLNFGTIRSYKDYLQFLSDIEQNVPKMRVNGVGISDGGSGSSGGTDGQQQTNTQSGGFNADPLVVEMYVK